MTTLSTYLQRVAKELRAVRPTAADRKRNPSLDLDAIYRGDVEHTIERQGLSGAAANAFRLACGLEVRS